jgi:mannose-6-phosphate isomerase
MDRHKMLYPLRFQPLLKRYLWGGRRLETELGKTLGDGDDYAESWELVDHGADQSVVLAGPLCGTTLHSLVREQGRDLLGRHFPQDGFPILWKFLDAHKALSVQVHPDDSLAAKLDPPDRGKTEAWVVLAAEPGSLLYAGLEPGVDRTTFERAIAEGTCPSCLHRVEPDVGDCFYIPAGTVHALGAGLLVAEIQQASDTTYRLFDWDRIGPDGKKRPLQIEAGLAAVDFSRGPVSSQIPKPTDRPGVECLIDDEKFRLDRLLASGPLAIGGDERCHILVNLADPVYVAGDAMDRPLSRGEVMLLPASLGEVAIDPAGETTLLDAFLP